MHFVLILDVNTCMCLALQGIPTQPDDKKCGLFVMRFMRDIVRGKNLKFLSQVHTCIFEEFDIHMHLQIYWFNR
jgi:hypothetical protein